jgi:hypothetical protein
MSSTMENIRVTPSGGTPAGDSNDYILFDSTVAFTDSLDAHGISRVIFSLNSNQAGTRKAYFSQNRGTTWTLYDSVAVAAYSSPAAAGPFDYVVDTYRDWKLVWTNGGTIQTTWIVSIVLIRGFRGTVT